MCGQGNHHRSILRLNATELIYPNSESHNGDVTWAFMCFKSPWATVCSKIYSGYQHRKHLSLILLACWTPSIKGQTYRRFHVMTPYWAVKYLISLAHPMLDQLIFHEDAIKWKHFPRYWPFVRGIHRSPMNSPHKGQWRGALVIELCLKKLLSKQPRRLCFKTPSCSLWRHCNVKCTTKQHHTTIHLPVSTCIL